MYPRQVIDASFCEPHPYDTHEITYPDSCLALLAGFCRERRCASAQIELTGKQLADIAEISFNNPKLAGKVVSEPKSSPAAAMIVVFSVHATVSERGVSIPSDLYSRRASPRPTPMWSLRSSPRTITSLSAAADCTAPMKASKAVDCCLRVSATLEHRWRALELSGQQEYLRVTGTPSRPS